MVWFVDVINITLFRSLGAHDRKMTWSGNKQSALWEPYKLPDYPSVSSCSVLVSGSNPINFVAGIHI